MQQYLNRGLQILILMSAGIMTGMAADAPPTQAERNDVQKRLDKAKSGHAEKTAEIQKTTVLLDNLGKSIDALEKTLEPLTNATDEDVRKEADIMRGTLTKLKAIRSKTQTDLDKGRTNANALQRELQTTLKEYFNKADPKMIADNFGVPFDGVDFSGTPQYRELTSGDPLTPRHYALGAEHTWDDTFWWKDSKGGWQFANLKAISQHEMVTTRDIYDMAERLVKRQTPGAQVPVARAGLMVNQSHLKKHPEAYRHIFGNKSFTPSVINNSTGSQIDLEKPELFRELLDLYTRGEGTQTFKVDGNHITYGVPTVGTPILCNSAGNSHWNASPDFSVVKSFYPHRLNIGATAIPAIDEKTNRRNDKAPSEIEDYSSGCTVDALIQRPRWNKDGTPVRTQYVSPNYRAVLESNLWTLVKKPQPKSPKDLDDVTIYPPELVKALYTDLDSMCNAAIASEGVDEKGTHHNLRGTSFASPTAAGVILAARMQFPDASPAEVMDAFLSSCEPMRYRKPYLEPTKDDVPYLVDSKTGWRFAPRGAGYGEFVINDDATEKNPDSWVKMQQRLKLMRDERMKLTRNGKAITTVEVGEGADRRKVILNGQPSPVTIELPSFKDATTDAMKREAKRHEDAVQKAFWDVMIYNDMSFMLEGNSDMPKLIRERKYNEALELLKKEVIETKYVSETDVYYEAAVKAVKEAEDARGFTYSVTVPPNHDICTTFASLRLKFPPNKNDFVILESPDGRMVPVAMSDSDKGFEVGSTSGFMRQSAIGKDKSGTWKIHTRNELDINGCTLVLAGTERNPDLGIIDVRETILTPLEQKEAKDRTNLPAKNIMTIRNPHQTLRELAGIVPVKKEKGKSMLPTSYAEQRDLFQGLLNNSELLKGGFIPRGTLHRDGLGPTPLEAEQMKGAPLEQKLKDAAKHLLNLFSSTQGMQDSMPPLHMDDLRGRWGEFAVAAGNGEIPQPFHETIRRGGKSFFKELRDPDTPFWQRKAREDQLRASREPIKGHTYT
jgi:hypothetical protein